MASKSPSATVYQQDVQFSTATVKEALIFSALLRQPNTNACVKKIAYAEEVLNLIGMEALADTIIGASGQSESSDFRVIKHLQFNRSEQRTEKAVINRS